MAVSTKAIKERLRSIKASGKVTKAMQLIAAAKMRKAVARAVSSRIYAEEVLSLARDLSKRVTLDNSDYLNRFVGGTKGSEEKEKHLLVVVSSNRGLCGAFSTNIGKAALHFLEEHGTENVEVVALGKKAFAYLAVRGVKVSRLFLKEDDPKSAEPILSLADYLHYKVKEGKAGRVTILFTKFKSSMVQEPQFLQMFPFAAKNEGTGVVGIAQDSDIRLEPDAREILDGLISAIGESVLFQTLLESNASEQSARMMAMQQATKAAGEMFDELQLIFNKARQSSITQELAEISAGRAALN